MRIGLGLSMTDNQMAGAPAEPPPPTYTISGIVYDADGSTPVADATVALGALTAPSAPNGTYTIASIPAGTSGSLTCTKTGYVWAAIDVDAMAGNLTERNFTNKWYAVGGLLANCVRAYQFIGAADQATAYVDWTGHSNIVDIVRPTFDAAKGLVFNGTQWVSTGYAPTNTNHTIVIGFNNVAPNDWRCIVSSNTASGKRINIWVATTAGNHRYDHGSTSQAVAGRPTSGVFCISVNGGFLDTTEEIASLGANAGALTTNVVIGTQNNPGGPDNTIGYIGAVSFMAIFNVALTDAQYLALYAGRP